MNENSYKVKTEIFEGPLDTLLGLIEKRKLFINDISLAQVADDFIAYVKNLGDFPIGESANFILIASTLVLIKSKSLLPNLTLSQEEEQSIDDLQDRLKEHQKYKKLGEDLLKIFNKRNLYIKLPPKETKVLFVPDERISLNRIYESIRQIISQIPKAENLPKTVVQKVISLEEMIGNLTDRITKSFKMSFKDFSGIGKEDKVNVIVSFLAMLELVKQGIIHVKQENLWDDIEIETNSISVPRY